MDQHLLMFTMEQSAATPAEHSSEEDHLLGRLPSVSMEQILASSASTTELIVRSVAIRNASQWE